MMRLAIASAMLSLCCMTLGAHAGKPQQAAPAPTFDPALAKKTGAMVADYHLWYGSAATMLIAELHEKLARKSF